MAAEVDEHRTATLEMSLAATSESIGTARHAVAEFAAAHDADVDNISLAVSEAVSNAVIHAFRGREGGSIDLRGFRDGDDLVISVSDDGVGVTPNPDSPGLGLGLALIGSLSERLEMRKEGQGTTLVMRFPCAG